ncbi:hypothetical protein ACAW74_18100 [Fibrella sp. WM1]
MATKLSAKQKAAQKRFKSKLVKAKKIYKAKPGMKWSTAVKQAFK